MELKNLVIDPMGNFPTAYKMFGPTDYFCEDLDNINESDVGFVLKQHTNTSRQKIYDTYNIVVTDINALHSQYKKIIIVFPVNFIDDIGTSIWDPMSNIEKDDRLFIKKYFTYLASKIEKIKYDHIIFLDYHDRAVTSDGENWLKNNFPKYSGIFKREYRKTYLYDYSNKVFSFPFLMFGNHPKNSCWKLFEERVLGNQGINQCVWPGGGYNYTPPGKRDEWCGRQTLFEKIQSHLTVTSAIGENYFNLFNTYKFFLHMNGSGNLCKRFYEGLSRDSLMIMEDMEIVFPFNGEFFSDMCVFKYPKEFFYKLDILKNDNNIYAQCKEQQEYILKKYFNYKWINQYIDSVLN